MKYSFITVKYLKERYPPKKVYEDWKTVLQTLGGVIISSNYEIGKTDTLHLHLIVGLEKNLFWNRLRGAPVSYHVDVKPLEHAVDIGKATLYMFKYGIISDRFIEYHREEMMWKLEDFAFEDEA